MSVRRMDPETARVTCRLFRRKTDYYDNEPSNRPDHEVCPEYPWCDVTAKEIGPDEGPVHGDDCRPGRACFVPIIPPEA